VDSPFAPKWPESYRLTSRFDGWLECAGGHKLSEKRESQQVARSAAIVVSLEIQWLPERSLSAYFELMRGPYGELRFTLRSADQTVLLTSQPHPSRAAALDDIESVRVFAPMHTQYQRLRSREGQLYFVLKETVGVVLGTGALHNSERAMERALMSVMLFASRALVREVKTE
jgi:uncharacterized protein YegP (UPF0339 family)